MEKKQPATGADQATRCARTHTELPPDVEQLMTTCSAATDAQDWYHRKGEIVEPPMTTGEGWDFDEHFYGCQKGLLQARL